MCSLFKNTFRFLNVNLEEIRLMPFWVLNTLCIHGVCRIACYTYLNSDTIFEAIFPFDYFNYDEILIKCTFLPPKNL